MKNVYASKQRRNVVQMILEMNRLYWFCVCGNLTTR